MMFRNGLERWWRISSVDAQSQQELREVYSPLFAHGVILSRLVPICWSFLRLLLVLKRHTCPSDATRWACW